MDVHIQNTRFEDFAGIIELCQAVYPGAAPWREEQLASHLKVFPEGQLVAVDRDANRIVGMAASLVVLWDDYQPDESWRHFTDLGMFTNHDPANGRTLYGAEIMVDPRVQGHGVGSKIYDARRELCQRLNLRRIRAGARLRGYSRYADHLTAREYVRGVVKGAIRDPTLTFQLRRGFHVLDIVRGYLRQDPESLGYAAIIEWRNPTAIDRRDRSSRGTPAR